MSATTTYGRDVSCLRFARRSAIVTGSRLLGEAAFRRLTTERGTLLYDPSYGLSLALLIGSVTSASDLASWPGRIRRELLKDKRLDSVDADVSAERIAGTSWRARIDIDALAKDGASGFGLVLSVDEVSTRILQIRA